MLLIFTLLTDQIDTFNKVYFLKHLSLYGNYFQCHYHKHSHGRWFDRILQGWFLIDENLASEIGSYRKITANEICFKHEYKHLIGPCEKFLLNENMISCISYAACWLCWISDFCSKLSFGGKHPLFDIHDRWFRATSMLVTHDRDHDRDSNNWWNQHKNFAKKYCHEQHIVNLKQISCSWIMFLIRLICQRSFHHRDIACLFSLKFNSFGFWFLWFWHVARNHAQCDYDHHDTD